MGLYYLTQEEKTLETLLSPMLGSEVLRGGGASCSRASQPGGWLHSLHHPPSPSASECSGGSHRVGSQLAN